MSLLATTHHRPWPLPSGRWAMTQTWHNLLFAHWPIPLDALRSIVPHELQIDTFGGHAWLGLVAFRLSKVRLHGMPEVGLVSHFPEVNVRTYVRFGGRPGVYFMSLDADNPLAIALAKPLFRLKYYRASIRLERRESEVLFTSRRTERRVPPAGFRATYRPCSPPFRVGTGSLEHWLTERYCYYVVGNREKVYRCDIFHPPWPLQRAQACINENTMALSHGIELPPVEPSLLYAHKMKALIWPVRQIQNP
jgi:uncharacterized protein